MQAKKSTLQQKIDMDDNSQAIQYYQYLRETIQSTQVPYWIGNPSVQIISGKILLQPFKPIHSQKQPESYQLYLKEIHNANLFTQNIANKQSMQEQQNTESKHNKDAGRSSRSLILCGIPNSKSPVEVMETECISRNIHLIQQIRVIKTVHIRYYGMLLLLKDNQSMCEFFNEVFGQQYSCLEMQRIILREIHSITVSFSELEIQNGNNEMILLRKINQNSEEVAPQNIFMTYHHMKLKQETLKQQDSKNLKKEKKNYSELVCAICFDQCSQQAMSILCGHYFDLNCLQKWSQNICPLCRYHQQPPIIKFCEECNQCQGLWICLICGSRLCCGANNDILGQDSHIYNHYKMTGHSLSMELQTKFLFDAKIPAFLHQRFYKDLILSGRQEQQMSQMQEGPNEQFKKKDKITQQIQEYELQVSEQMNKQRLYFEQQINVNIRQHRLILSKKRQQVQVLQQKATQIDNQHECTQKQIIQIEQKTQKVQKQLQILSNLIRMKEQKVKDRLEEIGKNKQLKRQRLLQLQMEIKLKKEEILNYRKNLKLKQRFTEKLKGEQVQGQFVLNVGQKEEKTKTNKKKNKSNK